MRHGFINYWSSFLKGDIQEVKKEENRTNVVINEGVNIVNYELDSGLIEFRTAVDDGDYARLDLNLIIGWQYHDFKFFRAVDYLESVAINEETETMWRFLAKIALDNKQLHIAER